MKHKPMHYIEYIIMLTFQTAIRIMPLKMVVLSGKYLAGLITFFYKVRNDTVMANLNTAFPDMKIQDKNAIRNKMYAHILMSSFESYKYMFLSRKEKLKHLLMDKDSHAVLDRSNEKGRGTVVVGGHYGFFEAGGHYATCFGFKSAYVVANQKNKMTEKLIDIPREKAGFLVIHRKQMMKLFRALKDNYFVALLSDQNAGRKHGVFVDFFGKKASTHKNPAIIALKYKTPMLLVNTVRRKDDISIHDLSFTEVEFSDISEMDIEFDQKVVLLVQRYTKMLEDQIMEEPSQYWWIHKRYKTQPK